MKTRFFTILLVVSGLSITVNDTYSCESVCYKPSRAILLSPTDGATGVALNAALSWEVGPVSCSNYLYFGTTNPPPLVKSNLPIMTHYTYYPEDMNHNTTYYWRINRQNPCGTTEGYLWSFTTCSASAPGQATNPSPANGATDVNVITDLSWTAGDGATSHDVYFGTTSPGTFQGNQTDTIFETGTMNTIHGSSRNRPARSCSSSSTHFCSRNGKPSRSCRPPMIRLSTKAASPAPTP